MLIFIKVSNARTGFRDVPENIAMPNKHANPHKSSSWVGTHWPKKSVQRPHSTRRIWWFCLSGRHSNLPILIHFDASHAGTLADAASPASNPKLIYTGGSNNGASSGILRTTDGGLTWLRKSKGLFDTRIYSVLLHPSDPTGAHLLAGTATGIYESKDFAESWQFLSNTSTFGRVQTLRRGKIAGIAVILAGVKTGIASTPVVGDSSCTRWTIAPYPEGAIAIPSSEAFTLSDNGRGQSVLGACIRMGKNDAPYAGEAFIGTFKNSSSITWRRPPTAIFCARLALHPWDPSHFIYSNSSWGKPGLSSLHNTYGSMDGGKTVRNLNHPTQAFHVAMDENGWYYTGAEAVCVKGVCVKGVLGWRWDGDEGSVIVLNSRPASPIYYH